MTTHSDRERIAARWLIEQDDPDFSDQQREELARWLLQSMDNCTTYLKLVRAWRRTVLLRRNEAPLMYRKRQVATDVSAEAGAVSAERRPRTSRSARRERGALDRRLGDVLRKHREARGLSQARVAVLSGMHRSLIGRLESGTRALNVTTTEVLARALGIAPLRLLTELGRVVAEGKAREKARDLGGQRGQR